MPSSQFSPPFDLYLPQQRTAPVVFNSPHSGSVYPDAFLQSSQLDALTLRRSEDCFTDELFSCGVALGCPLLAARFPRAYLDVNREPFELDPEMFADALPKHVNSTSARVTGGLGTIPKIVSEHENIYCDPLEWSEARQRIETLYFPYHSALRSVMDATRDYFGAALLIDCHSMPSTAAVSSPAGGSRRPDVILGDRYGSSCQSSVTDVLEDLFAAAGFCVTRNKPYAGGYITQSYGNPNEGFHAVQIEINRGLYMDEERLERDTGFARVQDMISRVMAGALPYMQDLLKPQAIAAE